jgi:SAM-dependent methyltransferase
VPDFVTDEHAPHLGGYIAGGDEATIYPELWDWLVDQHHVRSVVDVGCGEGIALKYFRERDCQVLGYDGIAQPDFDILQWDFTEAAPPPLGTFDLAWCCEFVEHVEERFVPNFLPVFEQANMVAMTHAAPGQPGWHHVNNQPAAYWKGALAAVGFRYDHRLTIEARTQAGLNTNPYNHFVRSGMVFVNP